MTRKNLKGFIIVIFWKNKGVMFSTGDVYPESIIAGNINTNTPSIDCCCVLQYAEIKSPTPAIDIKKIPSANKYKTKDPKKGTLKIKIEIKRIIIPSSIPKNKGIETFPRIISLTFRGTTISSSNVPFSFSLASDNADSKTTVVIGKMPIRQEIINQ